MSRTRLSMLDERMHTQIGSFAEDYINDDGEIESPDFDPFEDPEGFESIGQSDSEDNAQPNIPPQVPPPNPPQFPQAIVPPQNPFQVLPHNRSQHLRQSLPQLSQSVLPQQAPASAGRIIDLNNPQRLTLLRFERNWRDRLQGKCQSQGG